MQDILKSYRKLASIERKIPSLVLPPRIAADHFSYIKMVRNGHWGALSSLAARRRKTLERRLDRARSLLSELTDASEKANIDSLSLPRKRTGSLPAWPQIEPTIITGLTQLGYSREESLDLAEALAARRPASLRLETPFEELAQKLLVHAGRHIAMLTGAAFALAVAAFNAPERNRIVGVPGAISIGSAYGRLRAALAAEDFVLLSLACDSARNAGWEALSVLVASLPRKSGFAALENSEEIRDAVGLLAVAEWLSLLAAGHPSSVSLKKWIKASRLPTTAVVDPDLCDLSDLMSQPDGELVRVRGVLGPVTIRHLGRKSISLSSISLGNATAAVVLPYIKLDSGGAVEGAYVEIIGHWRPVSNEAGMPAIVPDRSSLVEQSRVEWASFVRHELRHVWVSVPHALRIRWSWGKGTHGAGEPLVWRTWFEGDLI